MAHENILVSTICTLLQGVDCISSFLVAVVVFKGGLIMVRPQKLIGTASYTRFVEKQGSIFSKSGDTSQHTHFTMTLR